MISAFLRSRSRLLTGSALVLGFAVSASGQREYHGRKYKPLEPAATITITVEKAANGKPISNAAVIFTASKEGKKTGGLEVKSNPSGEAKVDIIEVGSHVNVQVIADGFATNAVEFDLPTNEKNVTVRMEKPHGQVSAYDTEGKSMQRPVGIQEPPPILKTKKGERGTVVVPPPPVNPVAPASHESASPMTPVTPATPPASTPQ